MRRSSRYCLLSLLILVAACGSEPPPPAAASNRVDPAVLAPRLLRDEAQTLAYVEAFPLAEYRIAEVPKLGKFYIDYSEDEIKQWLAKGRMWEPHLVRLFAKHVRPGTVAVDVGAHIGTHSISLANLVGAQGVVYAFEPQRKLHRELVHNARLNGLDNIVPLRFALGSKSEIVEMAVATKLNEGGTAVGSGGDRAEMRKLDEFGLNNVSLIKIDVESYEDFVLDGARETILRNKPVIVIEIQGGSNYSTATAQTKAAIDRTRTKLTSFGYEVQHLRAHDYLALPSPR
jgi:FkbM family methyltransferase